MMTNDNIYKPSSDIVQNSHVDAVNYEKMYRESITNPDEFWNIHGKRIELLKGDTEVKPNIALQKARKLISSDKVDILVGPVSSSVALAIRNLVVQSKTPLIIPNAGANVLTGEKCSKFITRISFNSYRSF